jgi:hypothetical protein
MATSAAVCNSAYQVLISEAAPQHMKNRKNTSEAQLRQPREPWVEAAALLHPMHHLASHGMKFWSQLVAWHATVHGFLGQVAEAVEELLPRRHGSKPLRLGPQHTRTLGMHAKNAPHDRMQDSVGTDVHNRVIFHALPEVSDSHWPDVSNTLDQSARAQQVAACCSSPGSERSLCARKASHGYVKMWAAWAG